MPTKKKPDSTHPAIKSIKEGTSSSISNKSTLTYRIGIDDTSTLYWQVLSNSGSGYHSTQWLKFVEIVKVLTEWGKDHPISSVALRGLYSGRSSNSPGFLAACLIKEGILEPVSDDGKRHYQLADPKHKPFLAEMEKLKGGHSKPSRAKPRAKGKAGSSMSKGKAKPATGK